MCPLDVVYFFCAGLHIVSNRPDFRYPLNIHFSTPKRTQMYQVSKAGGDITSHQREGLSIRVSKLAFAFAGSFGHVEENHM